jgi:hypothetical protein
LIKGLHLLDASGQPMDVYTLQQHCYDKTLIIGMQLDAICSAAYVCECASATIWT